MRFRKTAFLSPDGTGRPGAYRIRYFSPAAEVPFCGHATITSGVALADRSGPGRFLLAETLAALGWTPEELDPALPPTVGYAGAYHLILAVASYDTLRTLSYDFDRLRSIMLAADLTTVQLVWREAADRFRARDPFPVGNVVEDPVTGAAAAAFGAYLRWRGELVPPARFTITQGVEMGRPSLIEVEVPDRGGGIRVTGAAVSLDASEGAAVS